MKTLLLATLLICFPGPLLWGQTLSEVHYKESLTEFTKKNYSQALSKINEALDLNKDSAKYFYQRAQVNAALKKGDAAYGDLTQTISLDGNYTAAYFFRAVILKTSRFYPEALKDFGMCITTAKVDSFKFYGYFGRGEVEWFTQKYEEGLADYSMALKYDSTSSDTYLGIGNCLDYLNRPAEALSNFKRSYELDTNKIAPLVSMAFQCSKLGDHQGAIDYCTLVIRKHSDDKDNNARAYNNRGYAEYKLGRLEEAIKDIEMSLEYFPLNSYAYKNRALVYIAKGKNKLACKDLAQALELGFTENYGNEVSELQRKYCK